MVLLLTRVLLSSSIEPELGADLSPAAYRSIITAYGNAFDPSSACWVFFGEMREACDQRRMNIDSWNVLLGALAKGIGDDEQMVIDSLNSAAAQRNGERGASNIEYLELNEIFSLVEGKTCDDASLCILEAMRNRTSFQSSSHLWTAPKPNSQTYCQVACAQHHALKSNQPMATKLFNYAKQDKAHVDGRFLNALLRLYGDDIEAAVLAWKGGLASAAVSVGATKRNANLAAAYNGLMHVCGRALKPDVALRLSYAMKKAGVEPNEVCLNSYNSGKRIALHGRDTKRLGFQRGQFETLLTIECTKYSTEDKKRASDKKIRIILS
eukprot:scaffold134279_cov73-Cyclotella_meneghiniana.AAC.4